ncbi:hypothetical protein [Oceanicaulis sp. MMSF_3324]|uniref:hypothetical protein n=1 Tax=Oceanicaulis sp. MMSF_3324 TaxID=3046702 RepID=UPI00273F61E1|nr:hypothetical protein [Oceanicaulis sp. MMSF_3324]
MFERANAFAARRPFLFGLGLAFAVHVGLGVLLLIAVAIMTMFKIGDDSIAYTILFVGLLALFAVGSSIGLYIATKPSPFGKVQGGAIYSPYAAQPGSRTNWRSVAGFALGPIVLLIIVIAALIGIEALFTLWSTHVPT